MFIIIIFIRYPKWNTTIITRMCHIFNTREKREIYNEPLFCIQLGISNSLFSHTIINSNLASLPDLSGWNASNVSNMSGIFYDCSSSLSLPDISKLDTSNITNMRNMFGACRFHRYYSSCSSLKSFPDSSKWNISNVIDMS